MQTCTAHEFEWLSRYTHEGTGLAPKTEVTACLVAQVLMLPLLEPFTDAFVRHACLLEPSLRTVEAHIRATRSGDLVRVAFALSAVHDILEQEQDVWVEAAAAWSHVSATE